MKNTINKTEKIKNDLKKIHTNVDEKLLEKTNSFAEVPFKLDTLISEHSKIAEGDLNIKLEYAGAGRVKIILKIPINFNPKFIILTFKKDKNITKITIDNKTVRIKFAMISSKELGLKELYLDFSEVEIGEYELEIIDMGGTGDYVNLTHFLAIE